MNQSNHHSTSSEEVEKTYNLEESPHAIREGSPDSGATRSSADEMIIKDPRELIQNPAVAPQMLNADDLRSDLIKTDD